MKRISSRSILALFLTFNTSLGISADNVNSHDNIIFLEQNWSAKERDYFYYADQGSRLLPYAYFLHLEQADNQQLLRENTNLMHFGLIPNAANKQNPDGLPIGLARSDDFMGPTCAACHTQQITYKNKTLRIDGGQAMFDLPLFIGAITDSIQATLADKDKLNRFQKSVLGNDATTREITNLKNTLSDQYKQRKKYAVRNHADTPTGFTRLDAFGAILNKALSVTGIKDNYNPLNAPTSIPYIWDTPQHDYVEWNGSQANSSVGALARNIGEVIGVFGDIETETTKWLGFFDGGYPSSIQTSELRKLENTVSKLHSPLWPKEFPEINQQLAKQGRGLYEQHCVQCHLDINRTDPKRYIQVRMSTINEIKTDPAMATNAIRYKGKSGKFTDKPRYYFVGDPLPKEAPAIHITNNVMVGIIKNNPLQAYLAKRDAKQLGHPDVTHPPKYVDGAIIEHGKEVSDEALLAYKARPLNGAWSSAPYLHNGAIPNMYQLLLPAKERIKQFSLGSREYDPTKLGYVSESTENSFLFDTALVGNSNSGHEYGTGYYGKPALSETERWALIEYLKTF